MNYEKLTKAELIKALTSLRAISESAQSADAQQRLLHDLQVYQIELEMQCRELRETQQRLEASRSRYADLYDFAPLGYMTLDKKGGILEINLTGAVMLGVERSQLLGVPFFNWVAGSEAKKFREHLRQCRCAQKKVTTELRLTAGDGKLIEAQLSSLAVQDPEWLNTVYRTAIMDITEPKRAEATLRESEERFRLMADNAPVMIWESGLDALCTFFNQPWLNFTGRAMAQELGNGWAEGVHPEDLPRCLDIYQTSFNARRPFEMEFRLRRADGEYRWLLDRGAPRFASNGEFAGYIGSCIDITVRKQAEDAVRKLNAELERYVRERTDQLEATVRNLQNENAQRARAEELLRLQSFIVNIMSEGACLVRDCDQVIVYANPKFESMFGYSPSELNGKPVTILSCEGDGKSAAQTAKRIIDELHEKGEAVYEVHNVKKDGMPFWCRAHAVRFEHPEFGVVYVAIHEDITESKEAEAERAKLAAIVESSHDGIVSTTFDGTIVSWNAGAERMYGYSAHEVIGQPVFILMPPEVREEAAKWVEILNQGGRIEQAETIRVKKDGTRLNVSITLSPIKDLNGRLVGCSGIVRDITERKQAQDILRRNEEYFRSLIENASDIISVVNADGTTRYESPSLERALGYKPEAMISKNAFDFIHPDDLPRLLEIFNEVIKTPGATPSAEFRIRHQDGSWRFFESVGKTLRDETDAMMIVVNSRDITERKRAEEQIQFLYRTTQAVNHAANFHEALTIALREICTLTGWEYGEAWLPSADGKKLECSPAWHGDTRRLSSFRKSSEELRLEANEGLPGRIWAAKQIEWMNDLASQPGNIFRRAPMVLDIGLKTAVGVPVLADGEALAVLVFFSAEARAEDQHLVAMFSTVAGQLGVALQRKQTEQELRNSHQQLRSLYASLQSVREEERTRVAREIHDELGQMLTALKIDLSWLAKRLPASQEPLLAKTDAMSKLTDMTIASVKRISAELRPGLLDHLGLAEAIAWQAGQFHERTGIECKVELVPENISLDRERATILFRIVQEALTNVARHAQATNVRISLTQRAPKLLLKVRDNGKGITPEQVFDPHSFGLIGIRERVHPWRGKIKITGVPGKGTVVFVSLPTSILPIPIFHHQSAIIRDKRA